MAPVVENVEEHQNPAVRVCDVTKPGQGGSCGFHLTRTKWDPYPWVCGVDEDSPARLAGLQVGDCVLEVNGEDVLGLRVGEIATRVRAKEDTVTMLLWNSGVDPKCDPESLCCGPMPSSLQRLSTCMNAILSILECPVCLDTIPPPAHQCGNGHLICVKCRLHSERCPVCRLRYTRGRSLIADRVYNSLTDAFHLREEPLETRSAKMRQRLVGKKKIPDISRPVAEVKPIMLSPRNKFLTRIMGKSSSVENLSTNSSPSSKNLSVDSTFTPNLKMKSLSSNEIFNQECPTISHSSSIISSNTADIGLCSSRSYQGSMESLTQRMITDFGETELTDDGALYHCPSSPECSTFLKRTLVLRHLQDCHPGPLVQYFKPSINTSFPPALPKTALTTVTTQGSIHFLKIIQQESGDVCVWMWVLSGKFKAESLKLVLTLRGETKESPELTYKSGVFSLANTSWSDIVTSKRGILLTKESIRANFRDQNVTMEITVTSNTTSATAV